MTQQIKYFSWFMKSRNKFATCRGVDEHEDYYNVRTFKSKQWTDKSRVVKDIDGKIRYITYYDLDQQGYRCAVGKVWITSEVA